MPSAGASATTSTAARGTTPPTSTRATARAGASGSSTTDLPPEPDVFAGVADPGLRDQALLLRGFRHFEHPRQPAQLLQPLFVSRQLGARQRDRVCAEGQLQEAGVAQLVQLLR